MKIEMLPLGQRFRQALAVFALLLPTAPLLHADPTPAPGSANQQVIVKIGQASLEEYTGGDPSSRVQLVRGGQVAQKAAAPVPGKHRS